MITLESKVEIDGQVKKVYYEKPISEIKVGDYVVNKNKTQTNKVEFIEKLEKILTGIYIHQRYRSICHYKSSTLG